TKVLVLFWLGGASTCGTVVCPGSGANGSVSEAKLDFGGAGRSISLGLKVGRGWLAREGAASLRAWVPILASSAAQTEPVSLKPGSISGASSAGFAGMASRSASAWLDDSANSMASSLPVEASADWSGLAATASAVGFGLGETAGALAIP